MPPYISCKIAYIKLEVNPYLTPKQYAGRDMTNIDINVTLPPSGILNIFTKLKTYARATNRADDTNFFIFIFII